MLSCMRRATALRFSFWVVWRRKLTQSRHQKANYHWKRQLLLRYSNISNRQTHIDYSNVFEFSSFTGIQQYKDQVKDATDEARRLTLEVGAGLVTFLIEFKPNTAAIIRLLFLTVVFEPNKNTICIDCCHALPVASAWRSSNDRFSSSKFWVTA